MIDLLEPPTDLRRWGGNRWPQAKTLGYKLCQRCEKEFPATTKFFGRHIRNNDEKLKAVCHDCAPLHTREINLRCKYKMTLEQYDALLESQGGVCAMCFSEDAGRYENFHVDHDHNCCSGKMSCGSCIRGLLCGPCNRVLGQLESHGQRAFAYLEGNKPRRLP